MPRGRRRPDALPPLGDPAWTWLPPPPDLSARVASAVRQAAAAQDGAPARRPARQGLVTAGLLTAAAALGGCVLAGALGAWVPAAAILGPWAQSLAALVPSLAHVDPLPALAAGCLLVGAEVAVLAR